ncbi:hypothetical protein Adt_20789 [Abeliophyllum distichum]|uniref:Uncharacterized protein n=1 Tax=Abeliophyllum distichum TaxID=126358 RepID=A0ABD1SXM1_9LAMI
MMIFFHQEEIWSQLEESFVYNDLPTDVGNASDVGHGGVNQMSDGGAREQVRDEFDEGLVESKYELDEEQPTNSEVEKVNYDFGFGTIEGQDVRAGPQAWPNLVLNPLTLPYYTKKARRPKKNRRKETGEQLNQCYTIISCKCNTFNQWKLK